MSSDNNLNISRRKILAGMGAVGAAGAGAGLGTSALFTDEESFEDNEVVAGQLDLKMDWEEHYSFPQIYDDFSDPTVEGGTDLDVVRSDPDDSRYVGLPDPENPVVWANAEDDPTGNGSSSFELYFQNTTIEAFPDATGEPVEGQFAKTDDDGNPIIQTPCEVLADVPQPGLSTYNEQGLDGVNYQNPGRTVNGDTYNSDADESYPLVNLRDVKPGDFGEFTFSAHLCDNDGYLWLQMPSGLDESENGRNDPEMSVDDTPDEGELAENVQTAVWYDDCDNIINGTPNDLIALAIIDTSASNSTQLGRIQDAANKFVEDLYAATQQNTDLDIYAGIISFENTVDGTNDPTVANPIVSVDEYVDGGGNGNFDGRFLTTSGGNSPLAHSLDVGREYLNDKAQTLINSGDLSDPDKEILLLSDGVPVQETGLTGTLQQNGSPFDPQDNSGNSILPNAPYESDTFDGSANDTNLRIPNPNTDNPGGKSRAEVALVARDVDGEPFYPMASTNDPSPNDPVSQDAEAKVDKPAFGNDPDNSADISGGNGITVRAVYSEGSIGTSQSRNRSPS